MPEYFNPIQAARSAYSSIPGGPLGLAALLGGGSWLAYNYLWPHMVRTGGTLFSPIGQRLTGLSKEQWDRGIENMAEYGDFKEDSGDWLTLKQKGALAAAAVAALGAAGFGYRANEVHNGLTAWDAAPSFRLDDPDPMRKQGSLFDASYDDHVDYSQTMNAANTMDLFRNDPNLAMNDPYARNFGMSIIGDAARNAGCGSITMGNVFDSAVDKFKSKLSVSTALDVGTSALVSRGMSSLFTKALDTMVGLSPVTQKNLIDAGTWAGAISAIIN